MALEFSGNTNMCSITYTDDETTKPVTIALDEKNIKYSREDDNKIKIINSQAIDAVYALGMMGEEGVQNVIGPCHVFRYILTRDNAVAPTRAHGSDSGFDVSIIDVIDTFGNMTLYGTGIKVQPGKGLYFDLVPRSSISKTGYTMANNIGIIDQSYTGEVMIALTKIDPNAADLELPCKIAQLIPRHWINCAGVPVETFEETSREEGGFGSTDTIPEESEIKE